MVRVQLESTIDWLHTLCAKTGIWKATEAEETISIQISKPSFQESGFTLN
jgi:hypothetical protein